MAALNGAFAFSHRPHGAMGVGHHLYFDVPARTQVTLTKDGWIAERRLCFPLCRSDFGRKFVKFGNDAHAAPAATGGGLDQHRELRGGHGLRIELAQHRHARGIHELLGLDL
ncbi:Uncharacterised protein [Mycobacteroides abscessus subsp. abscessus]|nr:Uncharacterised protein [Mycobacteroides abscessus subsp. abscessus]